MNVIFTCGGTGGHINPAIAVANIWKQRHPEDNILFVGTRGCMEEELVPRAGYDLKVFPSDGLYRSFSWEGIKHNAKVLSMILGSMRDCVKLIKEFKADVIIGTGGYATFTTLLAGKLCGVPTCIHEANAMPGLANRMAASFVDKVLICFPESAKHYRHPERTQVVGMPVRQEFIYTKKADARKKLGLDHRPLVVSAFGSQGAREMNLAVAELFRLEQEAGYPFNHIHAVGSYGWGWMPDEVKSKGVDLETAKSIDMREFIYDMPTVMAAADVVISRAGSSSCNEIAATGVPCVLIPSPNVTDNHQEKNARVLEAKGGAVVLLETECTGKRLMEEISGILGDPERHAAMGKALLGMAVPDSAERICTVMENLARSKKE